jgi:hypothetical protein
MEPTFRVDAVRQDGYALLPEQNLLQRSNVTNPLMLQRLEGTGPVRVLLDKNKSCNETNSPISVGMEPISEFVFRSSSCSDVNRPTSVGIEPNRFN